MATSVNKTSQYIEYTNSLKERIPIVDFYTKVTGIQFTKVDYRLRACAAWRDDKNPSLTHHEQTNTLTDYAAQSNYRNKIGFVCNHVDILLLTKKCVNRFDAIKYLADYLGERLPKGLDKTIETYTKAEQSLLEFFEACRNNASSLFAQGADKKLGYHINLYATERDFPFDKDFFDQTELGVFPNQATLEAICNKYNINMDNKQEKTEGSSWAVIPASDYYNQAIVFPLYNEKGNLTGVNIRHVYPDRQGHKRIRKCQIITGQASMYGLNQAISSDSVGCMEGEMNRIQLAARYWNVNKEKAIKFLKITFCTGSVNNNSMLERLRSSFKNVLYIPDVSYRDSEKKTGKDTVDTVLEVYNAFRADNFKSIHWGKRVKGYDLDDYLRENKDKEDAYVDLLKTSRRSIAEYIKEDIENYVNKTYKTDNEKDSCRFNLVEAFCKKLYNSADKIQLKRFYAKISESDLDTDTDISINAKLRKDLGDGYFAEDFCYYATEVDSNGTPVSIKISNFVVQSNFIMVRLSNLKSITEESSGALESSEYHANIIKKNGEKTLIILTPEDIGDSKKFWIKLLSADLNLRVGIPKGKEQDVIHCISQSLATKKEKLSFTSPGPHIRNFTETEGESVLRRNYFSPNGTLKTFLNKNVSIIDGKIYNNKDLSIDLASQKYYCFGTCTEDELYKTSDIIWTKLRKLHHTEVINPLLGFAFCAPIKHMIENDIRGLHLFLLGTSDSHKTSCARIMQNFYGNFASDETLSSFANSTIKALSNTVASAGSCVHIADEFKPSKDLTEDHMKHFMHAVYNGRSRTVSTPSQQNIDPNYYYVNLITTAEYAHNLETSAEARYLQIKVKHINTKDIYNEINAKDVIEKFKCFTPYMIAWQHRNIDMIKAKYEEYKIITESLIIGRPNANRIAMQLAMLGIGYYCLCKFIEYKQIISEHEAESEAQNNIFYLKNLAIEQFSRTEQERCVNKFIKLLKDGIFQNSMNIAKIIYDDNGTPKELKYSHGEYNKTANLIRFRTMNSKEHTESIAVISFEKLLLDMERSLNIPGKFVTSLKDELCQGGFIELDISGNIKCTKIPDIVNDFKVKKARRSIVFNLKQLESLDNGEENDREPEGF